MNKYKWISIISLILILSSALLYSLQFIIFENPQDTFFYFFQDLAFVPISVLLVTLVMDKLLKKRDKRILLNKMNMVVGCFFVEVGTHLLRLINQFNSQSDKIKTVLKAEKNWTDYTLNTISRFIKVKAFDLSFEDNYIEDLKNLKSFLIDNRQVLLRLLENPNLLEHESFTDLLWAISHLTDELMLRKNLEALSQNDKQHLLNDILRAYYHLLKEWVDYLKHLKKDYPYMYSLATRNNPLDDQARVEFH